MARRSWAFGLTVCVAFFLAMSLLFVGRAGLHTDEALFAAPLFREWKLFSVRVFNADIPLMNLPYLGALKTWLYVPLLWLFGPTTVVIRIPAILAGAATIVLLWRLLVYIHSQRSALIGCLLLASDTCYLLTTVFDWGPVVIQRLLLVVVMILAVRWFRQGGPISLVAGAFCCGLGVWDKAVFSWTLMGLFAGFIVTGHRRLRSMSYRDVLLAISAFCVGSAPLLYYNLANSGFPTMTKSPIHIDMNGPKHFYYKATVFWETLDGSALLGYLPNEDNADNPHGAATFGEKLTFTVRDLVGDHRRSQMPWLVLGCIALLPWTVKGTARKPIVATITACLVAWTCMAFAGGGGAAHHTSLLWPLPQMLVALTIADLMGRCAVANRLASLVVALAVSDNLLLTNQYLYQFIRNGPSPTWSDAIDLLAQDKMLKSASRVVLPDWGITDSLCVLMKNTPPSQGLDLTRAREDGSSDEYKAFLALASDQQAIWILRSHQAANSSNRDLDQLNNIRELGFSATVERSVYDSHGRLTFNIVRLRSLTRL